MDEPGIYESLEKAFRLARSVCDPVEYQTRQKNLLNHLVVYILERDKPDGDEIDDEIDY